VAFNINKNRGQSMVEYIVITSAIMLALLTPTGQGFIASLSGGVPAQGSFEDAVQDKQRGYSYALSLSTIPETDDLVELANYYDSLDKFPDLSNEIRSGGSAINSVGNSYSSFTQLLKNFQLPTLPDMSSVNPF